MGNLLPTVKHYRSPLGNGLFHLLHKIPQQHRPIFTRAFWVELYAVEIFVGDSGGEVHAVTACCNGVFIGLYGVAVYEIKMTVLFNVCKQRMVWRVMHLVPAHVRQRQAAVRDKIRLPTH